MCSWALLDALVGGQDEADDEVDEVGLRESSHLTNGTQNSTSAVQLSSDIWMYMYSECSMAPNSVHMDSNERKPKTCSETFVETLPFVRLSSSLPAVS